MKLSKAQEVYLKNKHTGGLNNEKGNRFESFFIVYKISEYLSTYTRSSDIYFSSQTNDFIDDFLIQIEDEYIYHQLKNTNRLNWGNGKKIKTLASDFYLQKRKSSIEKKKSKFKLIISSSDLSVQLNKNRPKKIRHLLEVLHFEYHEDLNSMIKRNNSFHSFLSSIMNIKNPDIDKLESLASVIYGAWGATNSKIISIDEIFERIKRNSVSFIKTRENLDISRDLDNVLSNISGFRFIIENNFIKWTFRNTDAGLLRFEIGSNEFQEIERKILTLNPTNFTNLEEIITV